MGRVLDGWKRAVEEMNKAEAAKSLMTGWDRVAQFTVEGGGETNFYLEFKDGAVTLHEGDHSSPNFTMGATEEVFYKLLTGELNAMQAYLSKQYTVKGSMADAMKFRQIGEAAAKAAGR